MKQEGSWYYEVDGGHRGPLTIKAMQDLVARGTISRDTLVWNETFGDSWKRLGDTGILNPERSVVALKPKRYLGKILQPGEQVLAIGRLHWIIFKDAAIALALSCVALWIAVRGGPTPAPLDAVQLFALVSAVVLLVAAICLAIGAWFEGWITEIAVTSQRIIYKRGFIRRQTIEMNMNRVESVTVTQSVLGRILNYGSIHVRGTGVGLEHLHRIANPVALRNQIVAR